MNLNTTIGALPAGTCAAAADSLSGPDVALAASLAALKRHLATDTADVPDDVIVEWCDREAELLRALAATRPCSLPGLLQKVAAALDRLFVESGDGKLSTFTPADQELFKAVAEDVTVALALIAPA